MSYLSHEIIRRSLSVGAVLAVGMGISGCGSSAEPGPGYDVSYPQCDQTDETESIDLPDARSFAAVGLNNGRAKTFNPCFAEQMDWARESVGDTTQPAAAIYINSGNPGQASATSWPESGNFNGVECTGEDSQACAYIYGTQLAAWSIEKYVEEYGDDNDIAAADVPWWIDVETGNSWQCNEGLADLCAEDSAEPVTDGAFTRNAAVVHGMVSELQANGITAGIYTNPRQWDLIVSNVPEYLPEYSNFANVPVWMMGAADEQQALEACQQHSFGGLGEIVMSQYNPDIYRELDKNVVCEQG